ncbi:MAG TPA: nucleotide-binding protein [Actinomycetota bacterium]
MYVRRLVSLKERLELYEEAASAPRPQEGQSAPAAKTVFVVHGRSEAPKQAVARFIEQVSSMKPIVLHEQPNRGLTITEKFENYAAAAAFALILLTGDDEGGLLGSGKLHRRARQNVVFELGFFIAKLGRTRVAVLHEEEVELPSDMSGLLYTPLDAGGAWKMDLAREMRAAGFEVDLNRAL